MVTQWKMYSLSVFLNEQLILSGDFLYSHTLGSYDVKLNNILQRVFFKYSVWNLKNFIVQNSLLFMYLTHVYTICGMNVTVAGYYCIGKHHQITNHNLEREILIKTNVHN